MFSGSRNPILPLLIQKQLCAFNHSFCPSPFEMLQPFFFFFEITTTPKISAPKLCLVLQDVCGRSFRQWDSCSFRGVYSVVVPATGGCRASAGVSRAGCSPGTVHFSPFLVMVPLHARYSQEEKGSAYKACQCLTLLNFIFTC